MKCEKNYDIICVHIPWSKWLRRAWQNINIWRYRCHSHEAEDCRGAGAYDSETSRAHKCQVSHDFDRNVVWVLNILIDSFRWRKVFLKPLPTFCLVFALYFYSFVVPTFIREGIEFLSLEDKVHTFEVGKAMLDKVTHIHVFLWPEMVLSAKRAEVLSSLFICMYSVSVY